MCFSSAYTVQVFVEEVPNDQQEFDQSMKTSVILPKI